MVYFPLLYRWRGEDRLLLWHSGDADSVMVDSDGYVQSFSNLGELNSFADAKEFRVEQEEPKLHDLDFIERWLGGKQASVDCIETLNA